MKENAIASAYATSKYIYISTAIHHIFGYARQAVGMFSPHGLDLQPITYKPFCDTILAKAQHLLVSMSSSASRTRITSSS